MRLSPSRPPVGPAEECPGQPPPARPARHPRWRPEASLPRQPPTPGAAPCRRAPATPPRSAQAAAEAEGEGAGPVERLGDGVGLGDADDGQVWVRLKKSAVPVMSAVAPTRVQPAGVTIQAFDVAGPPLEKLPGLLAAVIVLV